MTQIVVPDMRSGLVQIAQQVIQEGDTVKPRGLLTYELVGAQIRVLDPTDTLPVGINRKLSTRFAAVEAAQLVGGVSDVALTLRINPNMEQFLDNEPGTNHKHFHGAYGPRIQRSIRRAIGKLLNDQDSRQAVVNIWDSNKDLSIERRDLPCTCILHFMIRSDRLVMVTTMRSNDVWWGLSYDVFQFTQLQLTVCHVLGIEPGVYVHNADSLHVYDRDVEAIGNLDWPSTPRPEWHPTGFQGEGMLDAQQRAQSILKGRHVLDMNESEVWYWRQLHGE